MRRGATLLWTGAALGGAWLVGEFSPTFIAAVGLGDFDILTRLCLCFLFLSLFERLPHRH